MNNKRTIIGLELDAISFSESMEMVIQWGLANKPTYVCFANVHMTIEAHNDPIFRKQVNDASLVLPDGKPLAKACKWLYGKEQERIAGMDFMPRILAEAGKKNLRVFLYGSTDALLQTLQTTIKKDYPDTVIAGTISPPFRPLEKEEEEQFSSAINRSGAHLVLVSLGCPKQEKWMANNYTKINAVLLGVGGAFMVTAGLQKRSPRWMQRYGLEWLYRLGQEPRRLFKRYFVTNTYFIWLLMKSFLKTNRESK